MKRFSSGHAFILSQSICLAGRSRWRCTTGIAMAGEAHECYRGGGMLGPAVKSSYASLTSLKIELVKLVIKLV